MYDKKYKSVRKKMKVILGKKYGWELITVKEVIDFMDDILEKQNNRFDFYLARSTYYKNYEYSWHIRKLKNTWKRNEVRTLSLKYIIQKLWKVS